MTISKTFEMGVSAEYQTYRFSTTHSFTVPDESVVEVVIDADRDLFKEVRESVFADIETLQRSDPDFATVYRKRQGELEKRRKYFENIDVKKG